MNDIKNNILIENISALDANIVVENLESDKSGEKQWYMEGIFIQGETRNHNGRIYTKQEIEKAVNDINDRLKNGSILGEVDHPQNLNINLDRVSHEIISMRMEGNNGIGKLRILPTESGKLIKTLLECGIKLGVSSRGSGEVDSRGIVKNYNIITVDIVATPSAPNAFPKPVLEALENWKKYEESLIAKEVINFIKNL